MLVTVSYGNQHCGFLASAKQRKASAYSVHAYSTYSEGTALSSANSKAPAGIDGYDVFAASAENWRVSNGVMGFLPEGQPVTPAESRYTVRGY